MANEGGAMKRYFSFGGGVQSMAVFVLTLQGRVQYDAFIFANVGEDSENPDTLEYIEKYTKPLAAANGIPFVELQKTRKGQPTTILGELYRDAKSIGIPAFLGSGAPMRRNCTAQFKLEIIARWQKKNGASPANPCITGIGISMDELERARAESGFAWQLLEYPLLDPHLNRMACTRIITDYGLPVPPKSSCYFCPFKRRDEWKRLKSEKPELFQKAVDLEIMLNDRRRGWGKDEIFLHASKIPLDRAVGDQMGFDFNEANLTCDIGNCFT